jgi:hypothetical protein
VEPDSLHREEGGDEQQRHAKPITQADVLAQGRDAKQHGNDRGI